MILYINVGSITNAQRGNKLLRAQGYRSQIKKAENPDKQEGCGYAILVESKDKAPIEILLKAKINIRGVEER
jgi:hypothetical protein